MTWNKRLTLAREAAGLSKSKLAQLVGVSSATMTDWESGEIVALSAENMLALADILKTTPHWLMRGQGIGPGEMLMGHNLGERIRAARLKKVMSQERLAEIIGVSKGAVSQWETNATFPRKEYMAPLASALGVTVNWLNGRDDTDLDTVVRRQTHVSGMGLVSRISTALADNQLTQGHIDLMSDLLAQLTLRPLAAPAPLQDS